MNTPDEQVTKRIVEKLRKEKLLSDSALAKLEPKLAAGTMTAESWKLAVELDRGDDRKGK